MEDDIAAFPAPDVLAERVASAAFRGQLALASDSIEGKKLVPELLAPDIYCTEPTFSAALLVPSPSPRYGNASFMFAHALDMHI